MTRQLHLQLVVAQAEVGTDVNGKNFYKLTGRNCGCQNEGEKHLGTSTCDGVTIRTNCNNYQLQNYEATAIIQFTTQCDCGGDEATVKHYGPSHSERNCCWMIGNVQQDGQTFLGAEGPHTNAGMDKKQMKIGSVGSLAGKTVGIKSIVWKTPNGAHQELWVDPTGSGTKWNRLCLAFQSGFRRYIHHG